MLVKMGNHDHHLKGLLLLLLLLFPVIILLYFRDDARWVILPTTPFHKLPQL
jgi:hypothetical protein